MIRPKSEPGSRASQRTRVCDGFISVLPPPQHLPLDIGLLARCRSDWLRAAHPDGRTSEGG